MNQQQQPVETIEQELARLRKENEALKAGKKPRALTLKIAEKSGALSVYGFGQYPTTLYKEQWLRLLAISEQIKEFIKENDSRLSSKADKK